MRGFTLIELLITSLVATCGLVVVASMFSFAIRANWSNRQMAVATTLLYDKMEEFKSTPLNAPLWTGGGGADVVIRDWTFTRTWTVTPSNPYTVTVSVYAEAALTRRQTELIHATTIVTNTF